MSHLAKAEPLRVAFRFGGALCRGEAGEPELVVGGKAPRRNDILGQIIAPRKKRF